MTKSNEKNVICYVRSPDHFLSRSRIHVNDLNNYNIIYYNKEKNSSIKYVILLLFPACYIRSQQCG